MFTNRRTRTRLLLIAVSLLVLALGAIEDVYGNTDDGDVYGSDAVQYLDIARAIQRHDWTSALNPLWSQGYPVLLALARPAFPDGPGGDWTTARVVNFAIFTGNYLAFLYLLFGLAGKIDFEGSVTGRRRALLLWVAAFTIFVSTQICLGQVSRVNPDELVTTFFFLACGIIARMLTTQASTKRGLLLGLVLGIGFIVKAIFLALGCGMLALLTVALWRARRGFSAPLAALAVFALFVGSYGTALSHTMGRFSLGESGSINYAWHVNRLQKWVHWEGGIEPAGEAWPKPWIARFAQWDTHPPDFATPLHPSRILQPSPLVYGFSAPFHATYTPYYNPPYWYEGYRHLTRPRFQLIAIAKSLGDLALVSAWQPVIYYVLAALVILLWPLAKWRAFLAWLRQRWLMPAIFLLAVAIYVPVHLEGRYLAGFLGALGIFALAGAASVADLANTRRFRAATACLILGACWDVLAYQTPGWFNLFHRKSPQQNVEWKIGEAVLSQNLPPMSQVGVIAWTPNLHCDWAYIAHLEITSEIAAKPDDDLFWRLSPVQQQETLATFQRAGAIAVFSRDKPAQATAPGWTHLGNTPMWMYRFNPS